MIRQSPDIMNTIFKLRQTYNLKNFHTFESQNPRTKKFGLDNIAYRASQLWKISRRNKLFSLTFNLQRINKKSSFGFLFMALLSNLNTSRRLYLIYLNLAEYIVAPCVQRISEYIYIYNAIYIARYCYSARLFSRFWLA